MATLKIGEILLNKCLINNQQLGIAISQQKITGTFLGETLIALGFVTSQEIAECLAEQANLQYLDLREYPVTEDALKLIPKDIALKEEFIPIGIKDNNIVIGIIDPTNVIGIDIASSTAGMQAVAYAIDREAYNDIIETAYYFLEHPIKQQIDELLERLKSEILPIHTSQLTELTIMNGLRGRASDIHITPAEKTSHVFYRVNGILQHGFCFPKGAHSGIVSKIKVLSELDIAEQRLPQDGSFRYNFLDKAYDMRVSTAPTINGENLVIRILGGSSSLNNLLSLGFNENKIKYLNLLFGRPTGIILITGPTGSGKTTTLYAAMRNINILERNVLTVEDPVEFRLSLFRQTEVNPKTGYDFSKAGRSFMRQDPDVILLGEIRDEDTANIAIRSSITGHLVLSTLHTNDSVTAIPRLIDLGVDSFLLSSALLAIVAQRLVRKICPHCKDVHTLTDDEKMFLDFSHITEYPSETYKGKGCQSCDNTGYIGRTAIDEMFIIDNEAREMINENVSILKIREYALKKGMQTMIERGMEKISSGLTSIEELMRVL